MAKTAQDETVATGQPDESTAEIQSPKLGDPRKPRRRTTRLDAVLAEAKEAAYRSVLEITPESTVGTVHHIRGEEDRLSTHLFECTLPGYRGWFWFSTVARAPRSKKATVCEVGLLPGDDALLAPEWVPWADRLRPEDAVEDEDSAGEEHTAEQEREANQLTSEDADAEEAAAPED
ncbi:MULTISPECIES: DUF3027 domain-containing protein [Micrococcaceae]|uniref:DUF3027 domain-containing protein n=1 Tax=unclassified Kocuria TaxID=2649579 RepID=UPI001010CAEE|nr:MULTISPECIES: DUF3027 domain-containing protein [unclassified Kocuria]